MSGSQAAELSRHFQDVKTSARIGGSAVLQELSDLAAECINGTTDAQDAVAFVLSEIFRQHAEDRDERQVTSDDTYHLLGSGDEHLSEAVKFIEAGGSSDDAVRIIAAVARLTPDRLYQRR